MLLPLTRSFQGAQVSLVTPGDVSTSEAIRLIEMTLAINGYVIVAEPGEEAVKILLGRRAPIDLLAGMRTALTAENHASFMAKDGKCSLSADVVCNADAV